MGNPLPSIPAPVLIGFMVAVALFWLWVTFQPWFHRFVERVVRDSPRRTLMLMRLGIMIALIWPLGFAVIYLRGG